MQLGGKDLNRHFPKEIQMANRLMKMCSASITKHQEDAKQNKKIHNGVPVRMTGIQKVRAKITL